jgi:hypothetical protein
MKTETHPLWLRRLVSWHRYDGGFWLRIGKRGRGFAVSDKIKHPPLFSERYGYRKVLRIGKWGFEILTANRKRGAGGTLPINSRRGAGFAATNG